MIAKNSFLSAFAIVAILFAGCSSEYAIEVEVNLKSEDETVSINEIQFTSANSLMKMSADMPSPTSDGAFVIDHSIESFENNFVVVQLMKNGQPYKSEVYALDSATVGRLNERSEWLEPQTSVDGHGFIQGDLMSNPNVTPSPKRTKFYTRIGMRRPSAKKQHYK